MHENRWKVLALFTSLLLAQAIESPHRNPPSLTKYSRSYRRPIFITKRPKLRQSRILFLDESENYQKHRKGEIDLTDPSNYDATKAAGYSDLNKNRLKYGKSDKDLIHSDRVKFDDLRQTSVEYLDEEENRQPVRKGEIDLTSQKIKFDDDYEFTSPENDKPAEKDYTETALTTGNERYYDSGHRFRPTPFPNFFAGPKYYQGRYQRPYAPNFGLESFQVPFAPVVRNGYYGPQGWKARSPRVVFPYPQDTVTNLVHSNSHQGSTGAGLTTAVNFANDVVFRDQNFGVTDVTGTDDLQLQDLGSGEPYPDKDYHAALPHRTENTIRNKMDDTFIEHYLPNFIPLSRNPYYVTPTLIPNQSTKILPPNLNTEDAYQYTNITKKFGQYEAVIPKFKPITDEQIMKINTILRDMKQSAKEKNRLTPNQGTPQALQLEITEKNTKIRKGRILNELSLNNNFTQTAEVVTLKSVTASNAEVRQDDKKCPQGGTCEFFFYCWMVGGLLEGSCGSVLKGCCHRVAKSGLLGVQDTNSIEYTNEDGNYGPVINDESKLIACDEVADIEIPLVDSC